MFPLDGKIKLAVAGVSETGKKKQFPLARKSVSASRYKVNFWKIVFSGFDKQKKKSLNKIILFQLDRKSVSTSGNGESV